MEKILLAIDFSLQDDVLLACMENLGKDGIKQIVLLTVLAEAEQDKKQSDEAIQHLEYFRQQLEAKGFIVSATLHWGNPAIEIQKVAAEEQVDFIVTFSVGKQYLRRALLGSTSMELAGITTVPLLIEKDPESFLFAHNDNHFARVMIPTDFFDDLSIVIDFIKKMRDKIGEVIFVKILQSKEINPDEFSSIRLNFDELVEEIGLFGIKSSYYIDKGAQAKKIIKLVKKLGSSMIVLPPIEGGIVKNMLFGSTVQTIAMDINVPVMMMPMQIEKEV